MIDLSGINRFYEMKWFDGTSVWLKKPTEAMLRKVSVLDEKKDFDALLCSMIFKDYMEEVAKRLGE